MMARIRITVVGIALMGMLGAAAQAQAEDDFGRSGPYLGLGFALGFDNFQDIPGFVDIDTAFGFDFWAGYRLIPNIAVEAELEYLNGFDISISSLEVDQLVLTGNVKFVGTGRVQPFLMFGLGMFHLSTELGGSDWSDTGFAARAGAGLDIYITESISVGAKASYVLTAGDNTPPGEPD